MRLQIGTFDIYNIYGALAMNRSGGRRYGTGPLRVSSPLSALALPADRNGLRRRRIWLAHLRRD